MSGKIGLAYEHLTPENWRVLENVLYNVCGINRENVVVSMDNINDQDDVLIVIGEKMLNDICGLKGIMKFAGSVQYYGTIPVVPICSPSYLDHAPQYMRQWAEHIQLAHNISMGIKVKEATNQFIIVKDLDMIEKVVQYCKQTGYCSFDFETTPLTDMGTFDPDFSVNTLSISFQPGSAYVIPLCHPESIFQSGISDVMDILRFIFSDPMITKVGQNIKFDMHCAVWLGIKEFRGPCHDTMLMHQLIDENLPHGLKPMVREYLPQFANYEDELGKNWNASLQDLAKYNALDSDLTLRLYWIYTNILLQNPEIYLMYRNLTAPATKTLWGIEENGMLCDKAHLVESIRRVDEMILKQEKAMTDHYEVTRFNYFKTEEARTKLIAELTEKWNKLQPQEFKSKSAQENKVLKLGNIDQTIQDLKAGVIDIEISVVNFSSPLQLSELLFSKEGFGFVIPPQEYQKHKETSTNADNITLIKDKTGFIEELQAYRQLKQINSTYLGSILEKLDKDHYLHTTFSQSTAKTGRLSSKNPNLQNIITRTKFKIVEEAVALVKQAFIVPEGYTLIAGDYSQLELRIIAHFANETNMLKAYRDGKDLHELTAANDRGYKLEDFQKFKETNPKKYKQERFEAKASNFGFIYLISAPGFKEYCRTDYNMDISLREAEKRKESFFKSYPKLPEYHRLYINKARKFGHVKTFFGRRIHLPDINSIKEGTRKQAERISVNAPIQGTGGEMCIFAMPILENRLDPRVLMTNNVHDALYFYCPDSIIEEILPIIQSTMENLPLQQYFGKSIEDVPILVEFEFSKESWGNLHI